MDVRQALTLCTYWFSQGYWPTLCLVMVLMVIKTMVLFWQISSLNDATECGKLAFA